MRRSNGSTLAISLCALLTYSCAHARVGEPSIDVEAASQPLLNLVQQAAAQAQPPLARWGPITASIKIEVVPDHTALEERANQHGFPWLRAWTFPDQILLQDPHSWSGAAAVGDRELLPQLTELLTHELTHALMYQLLAGSKEIPPLWFREGMASVTAHQESRRMTSTQLAEWHATHIDIDLLNPSEQLLREEQPAIYSAAHRAFALLESSCGANAPLRILKELRAGQSFDAAFTTVVGCSPAQFSRDEQPSGFAATAGVRCRPDL